MASAIGHFESYIADPTSLHSSLIPVVLAIIGAKGSSQHYTALQSVYLSVPSTSVSLKETCLRSLAGTSSREGLEDYFSLLLSPDVLVSDLHIASSALSTRAFSREAFWAWLQGNWDQVIAKFDGSLMSLDKFLRLGLGGFAEDGVDAQVVEFFGQKDCASIGFGRGLQVVLERMRVNIGFRAREATRLENWLEERGIRSRAD